MSTGKTARGRSPVSAIIKCVTLVALACSSNLTGTCPAWAQPQARQAEAPSQLPLDRGPEKSDDKEHKGMPLIRWLDKGEQGGEDLRMRPFLHWRVCAERPPRPLPAFAFFLVASWVIWTFFSHGLTEAQKYCRTRFWRALCLGIICIPVSLFLSRLTYKSELGWPLALLIMAITQFALLSGLSVSISLIGEAIMMRTGLARKGPFAEQQALRKFTELLFGTALTTLLLLLPGIGGLPRIGTRVVMMLAILGMGGLIAVRDRWMAR